MRQKKEGNFILVPCSDVDFFFYNLISDREILTRNKRGIIVLLKHIVFFIALSF